MVPGAIFISHRSEYADLVKALKAVIQETAQGPMPGSPPERPKSYRGTGQLTMSLFT
jgi:hypothetical protein